MPRTISPRTNGIAKGIPDDPDRWIVLGWRGGARSDGEVLNATLKEVLQDPVADGVVVGGRVPSKLGRVLVPVGKGPHSQIALNLALDLAGRPSEGEAVGDSSVTVIQIVPEARNGDNGIKILASI